MNERMTIGRSCFIGLPNEGSTLVPAKVDTGADTSSIWASGIYIDDENKLHFTLFNNDSEWYTGREHVVKEFSAIRIRSSNGQDEVRYGVRLSVIIAGRRIRAAFTLADRSKNAYPILIGKSMLNKKFIVDVALDETKEAMRHRLHRRTKPLTLDAELRRNPKAFYKKYHANAEAQE